MSASNFNSSAANDYPNFDYDVTSPNTSTNSCALDVKNVYCESDEDYVYRIEKFLFLEPYEIIIVILYVIVFSMGLVGNLLVCVSVLRNEYMRTVTNMFLVNLALADFLVILFCLPLTLLEDVRETWYLGLVTCKVAKYLQHCSITVSVLTLTCISLERWFAICFLFKFKATMRRAVLSLILVWIIGLLVGILQPIMYRTESFQRLPENVVLMTACKPMWHPQVTMSIRYFEFTILFLIPFIWMTFAYSMISINLWFARVPGANINLNRQVGERSAMENALRGRKRAALMLIAVVVMFFICYLPIHVLTFLKTAAGSKARSSSEGVTLRTFAIFSHWLCYFNSAINPVIYNFMSVKFRREFKKAFLCRHSRRPAWIRSYSFSQRSVSVRARLPANTEHLSMTDMPGRSEQTPGSHHKSHSPILPHASSNSGSGNSHKNGAGSDFLSPYAATRTSPADGVA